MRLAHMRWCTETCWLSCTKGYHTLLQTWSGAQERKALREELAAATARGDTSVVQVWAGGAVGLIKSVDEPAQALVERIAAEAAACLRCGAALVADEG